MVAFNVVREWCKSQGTASELRGGKKKTSGGREKKSVHTNVSVALSESLALIMSATYGRRDRDDANNGSGPVERSKHGIAPPRGPPRDDVHDQVDQQMQDVVRNNLRLDESDRRERLETIERYSPSYHSEDKYGREARYEDGRFEEVPPHHPTTSAQHQTTQQSMVRAGLIAVGGVALLGSVGGSVAAMSRANAVAKQATELASRLDVLDALVGNATTELQKSIHAQYRQPFEDMATLLEKMTTELCSMRRAVKLVNAEHAAIRSEFETVIAETRAALDSSRIEWSEMLKESASLIFDQLRNDVVASVRREMGEYLPVLLDSAVTKLGRPDSSSDRDRLREEDEVARTPKVQASVALTNPPVSPEDMPIAQENSPSLHYTAADGTPVGPVRVTDSVTNVDASSSLYNPS